MTPLSAEALAKLSKEGFRFKGEGERLGGGGGVGTFVVLGENDLMVDLHDGQTLP
jgi:hypothetical protein